MRVLGYKNFPYLPPFTGKVERPTHRRFWEKSVYYWWWEYMKRSDPDKWSPQVREDFGDINRPFVEWWVDRGEFLFAEPERPYEFKRVMEQLPPEVFSDDSVMIVQVPLDEPVTELKKRFNRLLDAHHIGDIKQGERAARSSKARYPVVGQPNVKALKATLIAYDLRMSGKKLWEITDALYPGEYKILDTTDKNQMNVIANRYIKKANAMINNSAQGRFPDIKER